VTQSADVLRNLVATTADATSKSNSERMNDIAKRLLDNTAELSKESPIFERIQSATMGRKAGPKTFGFGFSRGMMVLVAVGTFLIQKNKKSRGAAC